MESPCIDCAHKEVASAGSTEVMLVMALSCIADAGEVFGEGDYYAGYEAGLKSAAEIAEEAIVKYRKGME